MHHACPLILTDFFWLLHDLKWRLRIVDLQAKVVVIVLNGHYILRLLQLACIVRVVAGEIDVGRRILLLVNCCHRVFCLVRHLHVRLRSGVVSFYWLVFYIILGCCLLLIISIIYLDAILNVIVKLFALLVTEFVQIEFELLIVFLLGARRLLTAHIFDDRHDSSQLLVVQLVDLFNEQKPVMIVFLLCVI